MLQLANRTSFAAGLFPAWDREANEVALLVVKCTFAVSAGQQVSPAEEQVPLALADEYHGEPGKSSLRIANDLALFKPAVDVIVSGSVYTPRGVAVQRLKVGLLIGNTTRILRVTGDRAWTKGLIGYRITSPDRFTRMSLTYELAYGGTGPEAADTRNPVGRGFPVEKSGLLPNIEWDDAILENWRGRPEPAGLGFVAPAWHPRVAYVGTYDEHWLENRMPFLPEDFDYRHFQTASPRLTFPSLSTGVPIVLEHMTPEGVFSFKLPEARLSAVFHHDVGRGEAELRRDTVVVEPDLRRVILVHRALIPCHRNHLGLREVVVGDLTDGAKRAFLTGKRYWDMKRQDGTLV
jgi:hypothetical protein